MKHFLVALALSAFLVGCMSTEPYYRKDARNWESTPLPSHELAYSVFLVGDAGEPDKDPYEPALAAMQNMLGKADADKTAVVWLGDNLYPTGLHGKNHPLRAQDEENLLLQIKAVKDFKGKIFFIPGNHDWEQGGKNGLRHVNREEAFIEKHLGGKNVFRPDDGCPGPVVKKLTDDVVLMIIDSQWWLHRHKRSEGEKDGCDVKDEFEFEAQLTDQLKRNRTKKILLVAHHPLYSNGGHGGKFMAKDHLFPLTAISKKAYIPMPILGSIYPIYRSQLGNIQDIPHPKYQALKNTIVTALNEFEFEHVTYAAGHEHSLQLTNQDGFNHIISGSGVKYSYVRHNRQLEFGQASTGFAVMRYYANGEVWTEFYTPEGTENPTAKLAYRKQLKGPDPEIPTEDVAHPVHDDFMDSTITVVPRASYEAGALKRFTLGNLYRDVWTEPITVPVLDLHHEKGGLTPMKMGGGMQTSSLRYEGGDGYQYVTRSIDKNLARGLPPELREIFAADLLQDGIAASHPYASVVVGKIADAAGVYHSNPKLVYVPKDPKLGEYMETFGDMLCLFEERPVGDQSHQPSFGRSKEIVSSPDMIHNLEHNWHHQVDDHHMLRSRLFDMVIGDFDRHDDQWRWASFEKGKKTIYRPIPRDRDQAFFKQDGFFPWWSSRKWAVRKFQSFKPTIRDIGGFNFNARWVDRAYLTELDLEEWLSIADSMQTELTDAVFEDALKDFPEPAYNLRGDELLETLKARRANLKLFAEEYFKVLAREVNVVGTHKDEFFEIKRLNDEETEVTVYPRNKKGKPERKKVLYQRVFKRSETKEIIVYGLDGNDEYHVLGEVNKGILVRIVGGSEKDKFETKDKVRGMRKLTVIYDTQENKKKKRNKLELGPEGRDVLVKKSHRVEYDRESFKYDFLGPVAYVGFNPDDGLFLGGGFDRKKFGFNKDPYKSRHTLKANYAVRTGAWNFNYHFDYQEVLGSWDIASDLHVQAPNFLFNFYGLGNELPRVSAAQAQYRVRLNIAEWNPKLKYQRGALNNHKFQIGPSLQYIDPDDDVTALEEIVPGFVAPADFKDRYFGGGKASYSFESMDNKHNPHRGFVFKANAQYLQDFKQNNVQFARIKGEMRLYFPLDWAPGKITLALRGGGAVNTGKYQFYQANYLGGFKEFRGMRRNRFGGDGVAYFNGDLRAKLFSWRNYILPIEVGVVGFGDVGRVWLKGESSTRWHNAYGGGLYLAPLDYLVITANYGISDDDEVFTVQFGFLF